VRITKQLEQVLRSVQFRPREERWNHPSLNRLRALGLVASARIEGTSARYTWTITPAGSAYFEEQR